MYQKRNPNEFDCPSCGNPLMKSRSKNTIRCVWCHAFVDYDGNILTRNKAVEKKINVG